jgi:Zn finger protein HypA/HybF involved in hydrogenase expression
VIEASLQFGWELATEESMLAGLRLAVKRLPAVVYCAQCMEWLAYFTSQPACAPVG